MRTMPGIFEDFGILRGAFLMGENMDSAIMVSIITGILSLAGIIITNVSSNRKIEHQLEVHQAVTETKLENLTAEVRKHNDFAVKIPVLEQRISNCESDIKEIKKGV